MQSCFELICIGVVGVKISSCFSNQFFFGDLVAMRRDSELRLRVEMILMNDLPRLVIYYILDIVIFYNCKTFIPNMNHCQSNIYVDDCVLLHPCHLVPLVNS